MSEKTIGSFLQSHHNARIDNGTPALDARSKARKEIQEKVRQVLSAIYGEPSRTIEKKEG